MNSTCDRDDSIKCQLPNGTQRAASTLRCRVPDDFWLVYPRITILKKKKKRSTQKRQSFFYFTFEQNRLLLNLYYMHICINLRFSFIAFCLYKSVLSVNSNYPPFLPLNQNFGYCTCISLPSKQLWLWYWPRFTILLEQYVVLCLGFLRMVYECAHSSVIVYSPEFACQFVLNVKTKAVWLH